MVVGKATGMIEEPVPLKFERDQEERLGVAEQTDPRQEEVVALGEHLLFSAALGALLGVTPGPWNQEPLTVGRQLMMHAVYGVVTALVAERVGEGMAS